MRVVLILFPNSQEEKETSIYENEMFFQVLNVNIKITFWLIII